MSDVFGGPGWWMASDGKWYAPEQHPNPHYRARYEPAPEATDLGPNRSDGDVQHAPASAAFTETSEISAADILAATAPAVRGDHAKSDTPEPAGPPPLINESGAVVSSDVDGQPVIDLRDPSGPPETPADPGPLNLDGSQEAPPVPLDLDQPLSVAQPVRVSRPAMPLTQAPKFDRPRPASVVPQPPQSNRARRIEVELGRQPEESPGSFIAGPSAVPAPQSHRSSTTAMSLTAAPIQPVVSARVRMRDRIFAGVIFLSGVALIVGTFLPWTSGTVQESGLVQGVGIGTIVAGLSGAAVSGPLSVGFQSLVPKRVALGAAIVALAIAAYSALTTLSGSNNATVTIGSGLVVVTAAAIVLLFSAIALQGNRD